MKKTLSALNKIRSGNIKGRITSLIRESKPQINKFIQERNKKHGAFQIKEIDKEIYRIINRINSLELNGHKIKADEIKFGHVDDISKFVKSRNHLKYRREAEQYLLEAKYVPQFLFAGGATRLGLGAMWGIDLAVIGDVILGKNTDALKHISKKHLLAHINRLKPLTYEELNRAIIKLKKYRLRAKPVYIGMGPRQLLQYRLKLEKLAHRHKKDISSVLSSVSLVFNLNYNIADEVKRDFIKNNFYGFNPDNIFILIQPTFKAHIVKDGSFLYDQKSDPLPLGHGHATMQMLYNSEALKLDKHGREKTLKNSVIEELLSRGCRMIGSHRINDMTKWTDEIVDIDKLAYGIYNMNDNNNKDVVIELVENPKNQKGGHWLKVKNKEFLCETLSTNTPELKEFINSIDNIPYNAFRNMYCIKSLKQTLKDSCGIKFNLKYLEGGFYIESVTGDITLLMKSVAFQNKSEVIHDIKNINDYVSEGIDFTAKQEGDADFAKLVKECCS